MPRKRSRTAAQRLYNETARVLAKAAAKSREERLFEMLGEVTERLLTHLQDEAKRAGVTVSELCPCYTETVVRAQDLIEEIDAADAAARSKRA